MAGIAKPDIEGLGREAEYKVISFSGTGGGTVDNFGLFDGTTPNEWNSTRVFYWSESNSYLEIEITTPQVNIWRCGTISWKEHCEAFIIKKWDSGKNEYVNITDDYQQATSRITNEQWEKTICSLPKGRYRFESSGYGKLRLDSEWYIEEVHDYAFLLRKSNQYYTVKPEYYENGQFQPLTLEGGEQPNKNDYENFGFKEINDLLTPQNTKTIQGIDKGELGEGKYFEIGLDNEIKRIINIE